MMTETTDHSPGWSDPRLAALQQADLPSFVIGWPGSGSGNATVLEATPACARQGLPAGIRAPEQAAEIARGLVSNRHRPFALARLRLPAASSPYLFYCTLLELETGPAVLFADPAASIQAQHTDSGSTDADEPHSTVSSDMETEIEPTTETAPLRFTFEADDANRLRGLSSTLLRALGQDAPHWQGATFQELEEGGWIVSGEDAIRALDSAQSFAGVRVTTPGPIVLDLELGGIPLFDASRRRVATRGFGILRTWPNTRTSNWIKSFEPESSHPFLDGVTPPAAPTAQDPTNVVPFNGALSPRDSETFRDIGRTLHAVMAQGGDEPQAMETAAPEQTDTDGETGDTQPQEVALEPVPGPRTRALLDALPFATLLEREGTVLHLNRAFLDWTGWADVEAFSGAGVLTYLVDEDDEGHARIMTAQGENLLLDVRTVSTSFLAPSARLLLLHRPTESDLTPDVLARAREKALDQVPWPVLLLNGDCEIRFANSAAVDLLGFSAEEMVGQPFTIVVPPDARGETIGWIDDIAGRDETCSAESRSLTLRTPADESRTVLAGLARMDTDEKLLCLVLSPAQAELAPQLIPLPETDAPQDAQIEAIEAPASAPVALHLAARRLTQSLGPAFATLLDTAETPEKDSEHLPQSVADALRAVRQCLSDLAALAEPEPDTATEIFDPTPVVEEALVYLQPSARRRRIILRMDLAPVPSVQSRPAHLARLVRVMLEEALDATPAHSAVLVSLGCDEDTPDAPVRLEIADAGMALDEVDLASASAPLSPAPGTDRFTLAGRPLRHARMAAEAEALGGHFTVRRGQSRGMHAILELPREDSGAPDA